MSVPNHKQEFHDHLRAALQSDWGADSPGDSYPDGPKNKYHISSEYRRVRPTDFVTLIKTRIGSSHGSIILSHISSGYASRHMKGRKYDVTYETTILFGTTALKQNQTEGEDRIVYQMEADIMQTIIDHPVTLTGNPQISLTVNDMDNEYTDEEIDFNRLRLQFTARFKDYA